VIFIARRREYSWMRVPQNILYRWLSLARSQKYGKERTAKPRGKKFLDLLPSRFSHAGTN
jgi:hypothetical protein